MGHWSVNPSGLAWTSSLPSVLIALTGKGLPFWNGEKERTGSTFLDWLQGNSLPLFSPKGISFSKTLLEQVEFSWLLLFSTSSLISNPREPFASCSFLENLKFFVENVSWWMVSCNPLPVTMGGMSTTFVNTSFENKRFINRWTFTNSAFGITRDAPRSS